MPMAPCAIGCGHKEKRGKHKKNMRKSEPICACGWGLFLLPVFTNVNPGNGLGQLKQFVTGQLDG